MTLQLRINPMLKSRKAGPWWLKQLSLCEKSNPDTSERNMEWKNKVFPTKPTIRETNFMVAVWVLFKLDICLYIICKFVLELRLYKTLYKLKDLYLVSYLHTFKWYNNKGSLSQHGASLGMFPLIKRLYATEVSTTLVLSLINHSLTTAAKAAAGWQSPSPNL